MLDQLRRMNRLGQQLEVVSALLGPGENLDGSGLPGEKHDAGVGAELRDLDCGFHAIDLRHQHIGKHQLRAGTFGDLDGLLAAVGGFGDKAIAVQDLDDGIGDKSFVIDNKDSWGCATTAGVATRSGGSRKNILWRFAAKQYWSHAGSLGSAEVLA